MLAVLDRLPAGADLMVCCHEDIASTSVRDLLNDLPVQAPIGGATENDVALWMKPGEREVHITLANARKVINDDEWTVSEVIPSLVCEIGGCIDGRLDSVAVTGRTPDRSVQTVGLIGSVWIIKKGVVDQQPIKVSCRVPRSSGPPTVKSQRGYTKPEE